MEVKDEEGSKFWKMPLGGTGVVTVIVCKRGPGVLLSRRGWKEQLHVWQSCGAVYYVNHKYSLAQT